MSEQPMIMSPRNAWCREHWQRVVQDETANSVYASLRIVTRCLEMDRFNAAVQWEVDGQRLEDGAALSAALAAAAPLCCYLGDDEFAIMLLEARGHGPRAGRRS